MSDTAVEQQPEHKEEITAPAVADANKTDEPKKDGEKADDTKEVKDVSETPKEMKNKPSFTMTLSCKSIRAKFSSVKQMSTEELQVLLEDKTSNLVLLDVRPEEEYNISHLEGSQRVDPGMTDMGKLLEIIESLKLENGDTQVVFYCSIGYRSSQLASKLINHLKKTADAKKSEVKEKGTEKSAESEEKADEKEEKKEGEPETDNPAESVETEKKEEANKEQNTEEKKDEKSEEKPSLIISNLEGSLFKWANEDRPMINKDNEQVKQVHFYHKIWCRCLRKDLRWKPAKPVPVKEEPKTKDTTEEKTKEVDGAQSNGEAVKSEPQTTENPAKSDEHSNQPAEVPAAA